MGFSIEKLEMKDFRGIGDLEMNFHERSTVLVGENGAGKSAVLDCLAVMLSRLVGRIRSSSGTGRFFTENDISNGKNETVNTLWLRFWDETVSWRVAKTRVGRKKQSITNQKGLKRVADMVQDDVTKNPSASIPVCGYYPVNRAVVEIPLRIRGKHAFQQLSAYDQALTSERRDFRVFFEWFRKREDIENEERIDNGDYRDPHLQAVRSAVSGFMPGFDKLRVKRSPLRMTIEKLGKILTVNQLSDGEKCLLALVGDLARRLAIANPGRTDPLAGDGIVLIDEVDLHLHPAWQRGIVKTLENIFRGCQFVVTTHSPLIAGNLKPEKIQIMKRENGEAVVISPDVAYGQDVSRILEDIMGAGSRPEEVKQKISEIFSLLATPKPKTDSVERLIYKLEQEIGSDPELTKARSILRRIEMIGR